jgi:ABC-2 type transport system ATP-binding protein
MQEVEALANRVLFINEGRLVYDGKTADLAGNAVALDEKFHELTAAK